MKLWHNADDAPRVPSEVRSEQTVEIWVGTHPVEPGQHVTIKWNVTHANGTTRNGSVPAMWQYNDFSLGNSYWMARVGPFAVGDKVEYSVMGVSRGGTLSPQMFAFMV